MSKINRRTLLGAAAVTVAAPIGAHGLTGAALAASHVEPADPIYAALATQREKWLAHGAAIDVTTLAEKTYGFGSPEAKAAHALQADPCHADSDGRCGILSVVPTTAAGMLAYLDFVESPEGFGDTYMSDEEVTSLMKTVRRFVATQGYRAPSEAGGAV